MKESWRRSTVLRPGRGPLQKVGVVSAVAQRAARSTSKGKKATLDGLGYSGCKERVSKNKLKAKANKAGCGHVKASKRQSGKLKALEDSGVA